NERRRIRALGDAADGLVPDLRRAADAFIVRAPGGGRAIVSGYPSAVLSVREALIALPGLCLATGRHEEARAILLALTARVEGDLVATRPADELGGVDAVDTGLWWVVAVERFREATGDAEFIRSRLQGPLLAILEGYRAGTRRGAGVSPEGLLAHAASATPPGSLGAAADGQPPRRGAAVAGPGAARAGGGATGAPDAGGPAVAGGLRHALRRRRGRGRRAHAPAGPRGRVAVPGGAVLRRAHPCPRRGGQGRRLAMGRRLRPAPGGRHAGHHPGGLRGRAAAPAAGRAGLRARRGGAAAPGDEARTASGRPHHAPRADLSARSLPAPARPPRPACYSAAA